MTSARNSEINVNDMSRSIKDDTKDDFQFT